MRNLTFKQYLGITEGVDQDIAALTMQKQQLLIRKATADRQFDTQIQAIDRQLYQKEKQQQDEAKRGAKDGGQTTVNQPPQQAGSQTTTPGSAGAQTPGLSAQSSVPQR